MKGYQMTKKVNCTVESWQGYASASSQANWLWVRWRIKKNIVLLEKQPRFRRSKSITDQIFTSNQVVAKRKILRFLSFSLPWTLKFYMIWYERGIWKMTKYSWLQLLSHWVNVKKSSASVSDWRVRLASGFPYVKFLNTLKSQQTYIDRPPYWKTACQQPRQA